MGENPHEVSISCPGKTWSKGLIGEDHKDKNPGYANKALSLMLCESVILKDFTVANVSWFCFLLTAIDSLTIRNIKLPTTRIQEVRHQEF